MLFRSVLGDILQKEGRVKEAYAAYDSCLIYNPNNVMCLNNYAYFLSLEGSDLKKAEKMSYRAITAEPNNGTYLDTYAWILYQQGRYEEARIYIEQALRRETEGVEILPDTANIDTVTQETPATIILEDTLLLVEGEILEHAGDIYFRLGQQEKALEMWQKALDNGVDDEATLRRKIRKKKL